MKNIVLIGLPGCGKTTIGEQFAKASDMRYLDLDEWIEEQEGASIPDLFASYGESYFRMMETKAAEYASSQTSSVISCGGGIVLKQENMTMLGAGGIIVFIDRDPAAIISDHPKNSSGHRIEVRPFSPRLACSQAMPSRVAP